MPDDRLDPESPNPPSSPVVPDWLRSPEVPLPELDPRSLSSRPLLEPLMPLSSSTPKSGLTSSSSGRPMSKPGRIPTAKHVYDCTLQSATLVPFQPTTPQRMEMPGCNKLERH